MSDTSSLTELARFVGQSALTNADEAERRLLVNGMVERLMPRQRSVGDLLGAVLALSARTRRMVQPYASTDVDVFGPDGGRAVRVYLPQRS